MLKRAQWPRAELLQPLMCLVMFCSGKDTLPAGLQPRLRALEGRVAVVGSPLWTRLHTTSDQVLLQLDCKVWPRVCDVSAVCCCLHVQ